LAAHARCPFDLSQGPLWRAKLIRLADDHHVLLLVTHHIACDGWSLGILYRELTALYEAFAQGRPSPLPALPLRYADFARQQREFQQSDARETQLDFWKKQLHGAQTMLDLPTDRPRPPVQTYNGAIRFFTMPGALAAQLNSL